MRGAQALVRPVGVHQILEFVGHLRSGRFPSLQQIFHAETGGGVMEYFGRRKIEAAKEMIRRDDGNFTEIANRLGYQSIYYFSRHFKKVTGMTPSEYASGVRALAAKTKPGGG